MTPIFGSLIRGINYHLTRVVYLRLCLYSCVGMKILFHGKRINNQANDLVTFTDRMSTASSSVLSCPWKFQTESQSAKENILRCKLWAFVTFCCYIGTVSCSNNRNTNMGTDLFWTFQPIFQHVTLKFTLSTTSGMHTYTCISGAVHSADRGNGD